MAVLKMPFAMEVVTTTTESMSPFVSSVAFSSRDVQFSMSDVQSMAKRLFWSMVMPCRASRSVISLERRAM